MPRTPAVVRRLLPHWLALAAACGTVVVAAAILAAFASFSGAIAGGAVRTTLARSPQTTISVTASVTAAAEVSRAGTAIHASLARALPRVPVTVWGAASSGYLNIPPGRGLPKAQTHVISLAGLAEHAVLLQGSWPGPGGPVVGGPVADATAVEPVAASQALAASLGLRAGMTIDLRASTTQAPVQARITGIFRPRRPASPYWLLGSGSGKVQLSDGFAEYAPLVTSPAVMASGPVPVATADWSASPDVNDFGTTGLQAQASSLQSALASLGQLPGLQNETSSTGLPGLLSGLGTALVVARSQLATGAAVLVLIVGATLALATIMLSSQREAETALLRSRGASRWQLGRSGLAEAGLLIAPAVVAGPLLGGLLLPQFARHGPLARTGLRLPVGFPAVAWLAAALVGAGCVVVMVLPWLRPARSPTAARAKRGRRRVLAAASRAGADLALIVLAVLAGWQLERYSAPVTTGLNGSIGVDPILVSAPVLALAAGAVVLLRLVPLVVRLGDRAAVRRREMMAAVAAWQISRRPLRQAGPVLLAILAVAASVLAAAQWSSWQRSAQDQASFAAGADVRVSLPPQAPLAAGQVASVTRAPGVTGSTPVIRSEAVLPTSGPTTLLALDTRLAGPVATIRADLAGGSPAALWRRLAPTGPPPGVLVPGRPARLLVTARLTAPSVTQAVLSVQLTDAFGISYSEDAGPLPASGAATVLSVVIAPGHGAAYPLRITGFGLQYVMPARSQTAAVLTIESLRAAATMTGPPGTPFDAGVAGGAVHSSTTTGSGQLAAYPAVTAATVRGTSLRVGFQTGSGTSPPKPGGPPGLLPGSITVSYDPPGAIPAAVTSAFVAATGQGLHAAFPVSVAGSAVRVVVVSVIPAFPTISGGQAGLVVDQSRLQQALAAQGAQPLPVSEWWLSTDRGQVPPGLPASATVTDRAAIAQNLLANPLGTGPPLAMLAIAAAAVILAAAGFAVAAATAGERWRDLALLAALGATRQQLTWLRCLEQAALSVPAAAAGLALGAALTRLVVPAVTLTATGAHPVPSVLVQIPLAWSVGAAAVIAVIPVVLAVIGPGRARGVINRTEQP